ncbi:MAG: tetratricopeptide repeat protein [Myxococcaceae bacterium]
MTMTITRAGRTAAALLVTVFVAGCPAEPKPDPKAQAEGMYLLGTAEYLKGNFDLAHGHFAEVRKLNPTDPRLPAAIGEVFLAEAKLAEALKEFEVAAKADPRRATNWSRIGFILSLQGKRTEAVSALQKALALNPNDFNALEQLAEVHVKQNEIDEAVRGFTLAAKAAPDSAKAFLYLRASGELTRRGRQPESLALLEAASAEGVRAPELMSELGDLLVQAGRLAEAAATYRDAASRSADPTLWELVGEVNAKLDKPGDAEAAYRESLRVKDRAVVHVAIARLCQARKDDACVQAELDRALETASGEELRESLDLADLLVSLGRKKDALALLQQVSAEPDQQGNFGLQLKVAKLAKDSGDPKGMKDACDRALAADAGVKRCP